MNVKICKSYRTFAVTLLTGTVQWRRVKSEGWAPVMTDGDVSFDYVKTHWEVVFIQVKHSRDTVTN